MQKLLPFLGICLLGLAACKSNTDCSVTVRQLQDQLNVKDQRISVLEDSLHAFTGNHTTGMQGDTTATVMNGNENTGESSYYRDNQVRVKHSSRAYPGEFPEGSERLLTDTDINYLSEWGLKIIKDEIYARHGGTFNDKAVQFHFNHQSWYHAKGKNVNSALSNIERKNIKFLNNYKYPYHS